MAVSKYFSHVNHPGQQKLINDLVVEAIQNRGIDVLYIPREVIEDNDLLNEAQQTIFQQAHTIEMYVEEVNNYNDMGNFFRSFGGFSMEDSITLVMSQERFREEVDDVEEPRQKDLIYIPYADMMFEVDKKLEDENFMQWGQNYVFRVKCTKFKFGGEDFEIDEDQLEPFEDVVEELENELQTNTLTPQVDPSDLGDSVDIQSPIFNSDIGDVL